MKTKLILGYFITLLVGTGIGIFSSKFFPFTKNETENKNKPDKTELLKTEETVAWTHIDLLKYLQKKKFNFKAEATEYGSDWGIPMYYKNDKNESLYVRLNDTPEKAKDYASSYGIKGFAWGKFIFKSKNIELLKAISAILDNKYNEDFEFLSKNVSSSNSEVENTNTNTDVDCTKKIQLVSCAAAFAPINHLLLPRVSMLWKNISGAPISESIEIEAVFYDNNNKEELARASKYLHISVDAPLKNGFSTQFYLTSDKGWTVGPMDNLNVSVEIYLNSKLLKTVKVQNRMVENWNI